MPPIYDENDNVITAGVESALSKPDSIIIQNKTLDGKFHVQGIGTSATKVDVTAHFTMDERLIFEALTRTMSIIKVVFDGRYYTGVVGEDPSSDRIASQTGPIFTISFILLVETEGVA
jgi:hypothetical protein